MHIRVCACAHVLAYEDSPEAPFSSETGTQWPAGHRVGWAGWPGIHRGLPVSVSPALKSQPYSAMSGIFFKRQVLEIKLRYPFQGKHFTDCASSPNALKLKFPLGAVELEFARTCIGSQIPYPYI